MAGSSAVLSWSGGKDAALCLHRARSTQRVSIEALITTASERFGRSSQHGVRMELVERQAQHLALPLHTVWLPSTPTMEAYGERMREALVPLVDRGLETAVFGDIFLDDIRAYREEQLTEIGMVGQFPLWHESTDALARTFLDMGFQAVVVCVSDEHLGREFVGRPFDRAFLQALPDSVDPCGENGAFHTFVYDGPPFSEPVPIERGNVVRRTYDAPDGANGSPCPSQTQKRATPGFWFCDLRLEDA